MKVRVNSGGVEKAIVQSEEAENFSTKARRNPLTVVLGAVKSVTYLRTERTYTVNVL